jgi:hypothetical protein
MRKIPLTRVTVLIFNPKFRFCKDWPFCCKDPKKSGLWDEFEMWKEKSKCELSHNNVGNVLSKSRDLV